MFLVLSWPVSTFVAAVCADPLASCSISRDAIIGIDPYPGSAMRVDKPTATVWDRGGEQGEDIVVDS